jgi:hypothetical protein
MFVSDVERCHERAGGAVIRTGVSRRSAEGLRRREAAGYLLAPNIAMLDAIRHAASLVSNFAADLRPAERLAVDPNQ